MIYLIPLVLILYGIVRFDMKGISPSNSTYKKIWVSCFWLLVLIPGLSYRIGIDTPSYMYFYDNIRPIWDVNFKYLQDAHQDIGWAVFNSLCKSVTSEYAFMHTLQCLILHTSVFFFIKEMTHKRFVALILYFVILWPHSTFGALRESIAIALFLIALLKLLKNRNYMQYFLIALSAILFHKFAFVPVLLTPLFWGVRKMKVLIPIFIGIGLVALFNMQFFIDLFIADLASDDVKIAYYMETNLAGGEHQMNVVGMAYYIITLVVPPLILIYLLQHNNKGQNNSLIMILVLSIVLGLVASLMTDFRRLYNYFIVLHAVLFADFIGTGKFYRKDFMLFNSYRGLVALYFIITVSSCINFYKPSVIEERKGVNYDVFYFPYYSVITKETDPMREAVHMIEH